MDPFLIVILILIAGSVASLTLLLVPGVAHRYSRVREAQIRQTEALLEGMLLPVQRKTLNMLYVLSMVGGGIIVFFLFANPLFALLGAAVGALLPVFVVRALEERRRKQFVDQLVDTLALLSSALKAGLTLRQAFEVVVEEMPSPTREEFALILQQLRMGIPLEEALNRLRARIRNDDVDIVVISVLVARDTGGNVTEIFSNLAQMIREKKMLQRKVEVLTAQARWQGMIISAMPIFFVMFVIHQDPHHFDIFFKDPTGQLLLVYAVVSQILGLITMRVMGKVEV